MKVGSLVKFKAEPWMVHQQSDYGVGIVTWHDGAGKYKVLWSRHIHGPRYFPHDDWELENV